MTVENDKGHTEQGDFAKEKVTARAEAFANVTDVAAEITESTPEDSESAELDAVRESIDSLADNRADIEPATTESKPAEKPLPKLPADMFGISQLPPLKVTFWDMLETEYDKVRTLFMSPEKRVKYYLDKADKKKK